MKNDYDIVTKIIQREEEAQGREYFFSERKMAREMIQRLLDKAKPGNWAWQKLEQRWGLDGDYTPDEPPVRELAL